MHRKIGDKLRQIIDRYHEERAAYLGASALLERLHLSPLLNQATFILAQQDYDYTDEEPAPADRYHVTIHIPYEHKPQARRRMLAALNTEIPAWNKSYTTCKDYRNGGYLLQEVWHSGNFHPTSINSADNITIIFIRPTHAGDKLPFVYKRDQDGNRIRHRCTILPGQPYVSHDTPLHVACIT